MSLNETYNQLYSERRNIKNPSVTVDNVILRFTNKSSENYRKLAEKKLQVCLIKREYEPFEDNYAVPGMFIDLELPLGSSAKKCVQEKTGLTNFYYEQLYTFGDEQRDPRSRVLSVAYLILTNNEEEISSGKWFDIDIKMDEIVLKETEQGYIQTQNVKINLINDDVVLENEIQVNFEKKNQEEIKQVKIINSTLAFDHIKILYFALERLKNKIEYTDVIFNLLPKNFTLTELKLCFEAILQEKLLDANFRRKIKSKVIPVEAFVTEKGHRPSRLFTHNISWKLNNLE
ncbi:MAG: ADP-ribose pyrophosphatase [Clostridia bacterium]|nr:ADP-ribose pyrophosphatase [Clostridia bacterium]